MITNIVSNFKKKKLLFILIFLVFEFPNFFRFFADCQNDTNYTNITNITDIEEDSLDTKCLGNTLKYYITANLSIYIKNLCNNYSEIENKPIYSSLEDLSTIGAIKGTAYQNITHTLRRYDMKTYSSYDAINEALRQHVIDGYITSKEFGDIIKMNNDDLTYFEFTNKKEIIQYKFFIQNTDNFTIKEINDIISKDLDDLISIWFGCDENSKIINKVLTGNRGNFTVALNFNEPPYSYIDSNGNQTGLVLDLLYRFANSSRYNLVILEIDKYYKLEELFNNYQPKVLAFSSYEEEEKTTTILEDLHLFDNYTESVIIIRDENSNVSKSWENYDSLEEFNNEKIGVISETLDLTQKIFKEAEIKHKDTVIDLFNSLLLKEINGFLIDELVSEYYKDKVNNRLTYYNETVGKNYLGFFFTNETMRNNFNKFIPEIKNDNISIDEILNETETINEMIKDQKGKEKLNVVINGNIKPFVYMENGIYKGFEINILYNFSNKYNYSLSFNDVNETNNVYIGCLNISSNQDLGYSSNVIYESNIVLSTRKDKLKEEITIEILDNKYRTKKSNDLLIPLIYSNISKNSFCIFPLEYSDNIVLNCSVFGLYTQNQFKGEYEFGTINNKIRISNLILEAKNFLNANNLFPDENIVNISNMTGIICPDLSDTINKTKNQTSGFKVTTASIIGIVVVGILFAAAILIIVMMYTTEIKPIKKNNYKLTNSDLKLN